MALLTGYHLCGVGVAGFIFVASARIWGKRHLYLLGTILIIISSAWGGAVGKNYASLLWARVIQGVGLAPFEALVNDSVGDLYFVHVGGFRSLALSNANARQERGKRMALSNLALFGGAFFTPVLVGKITHTIGWQWSFNLVAIFAGALLPFIFFFVPETAYRRPEHPSFELETSRIPEYDKQDYELSSTVDSDNGKTSNASHPESLEKQPGDIENRHLTTTATTTQYLQASSPPSKVTFAQSLLPFNGRKSDDNFLKLLLRPFPLFLHPAVFWACLTQGALIGWTVMIGVVLAAIFLGPPLWFNEVETGYMYTGPFVGAILGFVLAGLLADWSTKLMIRRNKGVYEPEFRIVLVVPQLVFGCVGLYGFGVTGANVGRYGWFLPDFFFACEVGGMVLGAVASALYIVDAHRMRNPPPLSVREPLRCGVHGIAVLSVATGGIAVGAVTCLLVFKNMFSFGLTWGAYNWLVTAGTLKTFYIIASIQVGICLLSVPMCMFHFFLFSFLLSISHCFTTLFVFFASSRVSDGAE